MFDFPALTARLDGASSERLVLRSLAHADAWPLFDATSVPLFNEHLLWTRPENAAAVRARVRVIVEAATCGALTAMSAVRKDTGAWVGMFRFIPPTRGGARELEMTIWMHPRFWVGRYSYELSCLCIGRAFEVSGLDRLVASASLTNRSSFKLMESVGMVRTSRSVRLTEAGRELPLQDFALDRARWHARMCSPDGRAPERATVVEQQRAEV
ncbi:MAG: GNAT family N-acetyltransferase [Polyangiales bacterium]